MHATVLLLLIGAATVGVVHSILPDHWAPIAIVARTQRWTLVRTARVSGLAAGGHVVTSLVLGGAVAIVGLQFQNQIENQQGRIVGAVLLLTGVGFLVWGLTGHGHAHEHRWHDERDSQHDEHEHNHEPHDDSPKHSHEQELHQHEHVAGATAVREDSHVHEHLHSGRRHSHRHSHHAFIRARAHQIATKSAERTLAGSLAAIIVPFGVAASPDLTFLPVAAAAGAYGYNMVVAVLGVFAVCTLVAFVGLTVIATAAGYHLKGEWLEDNANTITSVVLIAIGVVAFIGL